MNFQISSRFKQTAEKLVAGIKNELDYQVLFAYRQILGKRKRVNYIMIKAMFKKLIFLFFLLFFLVFPKDIFAGNEFVTDAFIEYQVNENGITSIVNKIRIENAQSEIYAKAYSLVFNNIETQNIRVFEGDQNLEFNEIKDNDKTTIEVHFSNAVVGKGNYREFNVQFDNSNFAQRTGEVWEISIPKINEESEFRSYEVVLTVPFSLGTEAYISPKPKMKKVEDGKQIYIFSKEMMAKSGVTAGFGEFQVFSFTLNYHLENPLIKYAYTEIALPPDTELQKVYYTDITPQPVSVRVDSDGNWIATYNLKPRERIDVRAIGAVQIFSGPRPFFKPSAESLTGNLGESEFWQVNDPKIKELAERLKTARNIYDYVSQNLSYSYDKVTPNIDRLGALKALENPKNAICMEYTDLFIAIARSAGIPAREINGFAYTENPKIQPLSLVSDVLHSWPEYWNSQLKSWVPIDPTWASTTGGIDFFDKLDLRHFTFVIHGQDPIKPYPPGSYKLGSNPQKDVFVNFGQLPVEKISKLKIETSLVKSFLFASSKVDITIKNPGPVALYNVNPLVYFDSKLFDKSTIEVIPPYGEYEMTVPIPFSFVAGKMPNKVSVQVLDSSVELATSKNQVIVYNLLFLSIILVVIVLGILLKLKKLHFNFLKKFAASLRKIGRKKYDQTDDAHK